MTTETTAQAQIRLGRNIADLDPATRLAYFYAADQKDPKSAPEPVSPPNDGLNQAARAFLADKDRDNLNLTDTEILRGLLLIADRPEDAPKAPPPFALDVDKINAAGLTPVQRLQLKEAFDIADDGMAQARAGLHPSARTVQQHQVDSAMVLIRQFLQSAA